MSPEDQARVVVTLVRARNPANIGAVARAMHDFGFSQLRVVNEYAVPFQAALASEKAAVHASLVLAAAAQPASLAEAVADCTLVLGTTAVGDRVLEHPLHILEDSAGIVQAALLADPRAKVALLFGSEKTGLSNLELSHCHALVTIPMNPLPGDRHLSMNLGQAVAVCLYTLSRQQAHQVTLSPSMPTGMAVSGDSERLTGLLAEVLARSGYARRHPANVRAPALRRMVRRMANSAEDNAVWTGVLRQLLQVLGHGE